MEASIIFHFAGRGLPSQRLALLDFAQLLDPRWKHPHGEFEAPSPTTTASILNSVFESSYKLALGGVHDWLKFLLDAQVF